MYHAWDNFFILTGTAGATLIGLLFVVVTLGTSLSMSHAVQGLRAFLTPTLAHFGSIVFQAMVVIAPWRSSWPLGILVGVGGLVGMVYQIKSFKKKREVNFAQIHWLDWIPYVVLPVLGNAIQVAGAVGVMTEQAYAPYAIAGGSALLLFVGIYGAWDLTLWMVKNRTVT